MGGNTVQTNPDFNAFYIIYDLSFLADILIWNTVEVVPVYLKVIC